MIMEGRDCPPNLYDENLNIAEQEAKYQEEKGWAQKIPEEDRLATLYPQQGE